MEPEAMPLARMKARPITLLDVAQMTLWLFQGVDRNGFDSSVLKYPRLTAWVAENEEGRPVAYLPLHPVVMLESLALNPAAEPREKLAAVLSALDAVENEARQQGIRELVFLHSDDRIDESAVRQAGFEQVMAFRKRL